jgi:outer membrane protein
MPTFLGQAGYSLGTRNPNMLTGDNSFDLSNHFNVSLSGNILLWDFGLVGQKIASAQETAESIYQSERGTKLQVVLDARTAYFTSRANKDLVTVARDTLANQEKHLDQIKRFVAVGTRPEIDLMQARTAVANARVALIQAENNYAQAKAQLLAAMGEPTAFEFEVGDDTLPVVDGEDSGFDTLLGEAAKARPELASAAAAVRAQQHTLSAISKTLLPSLNLGANVVDAWFDTDQMTWNASVFLSLSWTIWDGGLTAHKEREAEYLIKGLQANEKGTFFQIRFELEQARLGVRAAKATVDASAEALTAAKELLRAAEKRYEAGVGTIIELSDAQVALTTAAAQKVQSEFDLALARAKLIKALGRS